MARFFYVLGRAGVGWRDTLQVHPCKLDGALLMCAVLRTRQVRGWASCPTRPRHASGPWRGHPCKPHPPDPGQIARVPAAKGIRARAEARAKASTHGVDPRDAVVAFDVESAFKRAEHRRSGEGEEARVSERSEFRAVPRRTEERRAPACAARRLAAGGAFLLVTFLFAKRKATPDPTSVVRQASRKAEINPASPAHALQ